MTKDLTRGRPMGLLLGFGIPVLLGYLFQQLYSVIDTAIVGKILGGAALAAVGSTGAVNFLVVGFCCGICSGFAIPAAQQFGAGDEKELRRYVTGGVWLCAAFGTVLPTATSSPSSPAFRPSSSTTSPPPSSAPWGTAARRCSGRWRRPW